MGQRSDQFVTGHILGNYHFCTARGSSLLISSATHSTVFLFSRLRCHQRVKGVLYVSHRYRTNKRPNESTEQADVLTVRTGSEITGRADISPGQ